MSNRWQCLVLPLAFALAACGGGNNTGDEAGVPDTIDVGFEDDGTPPTDDGPGDEGNVTPDTPDNPNPPDNPVLPDDGGVTDPGGQELPPTDEGPGDVILPDVPVTYTCPCDEELDAPVCGIDDVTYKNDICAKCAICKKTADCPTCGGAMDCVENPGELPSFLKKKVACETCECKIQDACDAMFGSETCPSQKVCSLDNVTYDNLCDLVLKTFDATGYCDEGYDFENFGYFGTTTQGCKPPACEGCELTPDNPICGNDGITYRNKCEMTNCPKTVGVKGACVGACVNDDFCPACKGQPCVPVCGDDGVSYANQCTAVTCGGGDKTVAYQGACCPECDGEPADPVCTVTGVTFPNLCTAICQGAQPCAASGTPVCGADGQTYPNECTAGCHGGTLHGGACVGICEQCPRTLSPVCGTTPDGKTRSYQNACFATCLGGTVTSQTLCVTGCQDQCGTIQNPTLPVAQVCGEDAITYPNSCFPQKCFGNLAFTAGACP